MDDTLGTAGAPALDAGAEAGPAVSSVRRMVMESAVLGEAEVPNRILVVPWGAVQSASGPFVLDEEAARIAIAAFAEHGTDLPVDYEHQTLGGSYSSPSGQAPAAGWIKTLSAVSPVEAARDGGRTPPGLWAEVEWTGDAADKLRDRQYRYLSPVVLVRRDDGRVIELHSVALTNKPAIPGMQPLVNNDPAAALDRQPADAREATARLRRVLRLDDSAPDEAVLIAAAQRIDALTRTQARRAAEDCVAQAMAAGKLTAAQRDWAMAMAEREPEAFRQWETGAPVVVKLGRLPGPARSDQAAALSRHAAESSARAEYRANREFLEKLCTEEAFVAAALRTPSSDEC
jgi:phage I-like protein